jgi:ABC-type lipoprotein export system ATPase subunit
VTHSQAHAEYARRDIGLYDGEIVSEQMRRGL